MGLVRAGRVILVGAPGVGKGTQTQRLVSRFPAFACISSGDLLRDNVRRRTALGIAAEARMKAGELVPDWMMIRLIVNELRTRGCISSDHTSRPYSVNSASFDGPSGTVAPSGLADRFDTGSFEPTLEMTDPSVYSESPTSSFILDGFPRTAEQARQVDRVVPMNLVLNLMTPTDIILDRICNRWVHPASNRIYNTTFNAPKVAGRDDLTGEPLIRRPDDDPDVWRNRLSAFAASAQPLLDHYDRAGVLVTVSGNSSDEITPKIYAEVERRFCLPSA